MYNRGYDVEDYFKAIVATGERIAGIIKEKAGYIRPEPTTLGYGVWALSSSLLGTQDTLRLCA